MSRLTTYDLILELKDDLRRMEDKLDGRLKSIEERVGTLEGFKANIQGKVAVLVLVGSAMVGIISAIIKDVFTKIIRP